MIICLFINYKDLESDNSEDNTEHSMVNPDLILVYTSWGSSCLSSITFDTLLLPGAKFYIFFQFSESHQQLFEFIMTFNKMLLKYAFKKIAFNMLKGSTIICLSCFIYFKVVEQDLEKFCSQCDNERQEKGVAHFFAIMIWN